MPSLSPEVALGLWARACASEFGIAVKTNNKALLKTELYRIRKECGKPEFEGVIICDVKGSELFMCKKATELD